MKLWGVVFILGAFFGIQFTRNMGEYGAGLLWLTSFFATVFGIMLLWAGVEKNARTIKVHRDESRWPATLPDQEALVALHTDKATAIGNLVLMNTSFTVVERHKLPLPDEATK
jgi:hypothetical protein